LIAPIFPEITGLADSYTEEKVGKSWETKTRFRFGSETGSTFLSDSALQDLIHNKPIAGATDIDQISWMAHIRLECLTDVMHMPFDQFLCLA
jgi:hypothetical protein